MANDVLDRNRQATPEDDEQQRKPRFGGAHSDTATDGHQGVYDEKFKDLQASGAMGPDPEANRATPEKLKSAEESGATPTPARGDKKEQAAGGGADQIGGGYDAHDSGGLGGKIKSKFTGRAGKRKAIGVSIAGLLAGGTLGLFSVLQGPLQFVHLAQILQRHFSGLEEMMDDQQLARVRYKQRLGIGGNKAADIVEGKLNKAGFTSKYSSAGFFEGFTIDPAKVSADRLQGLGGELEFGANGEILLTENGRNFRRRALINGVLDDAGMRRIPARVSSRLLRTRGGVSFKLLGNIDRKINTTRRAYWDEVLKKFSDYYRSGNTISIRATGDDDPDLTDEKRAANQQRAEATQTTLDNAKGDTSDAGIDKTSTDIGGKSANIVALVCGARAVSSGYQLALHTRIILPLIKIGMAYTSLGSQVMSNKGTTLDELGAFNSTLYDQEKKTSWTSARSMQYELGNDMTGPDMPDSAKPGRLGNKPGFFKTVDGLPVKTTCKVNNSAIGGLVIGVATGGVAFEVLLLALQGVGLDPVGAAFQQVIRWAVGEPLEEIPKGAVLGNYVNYGTKLGVNDQFIAVGARELTDGEAKAARRERLRSEQETFARLPLQQRLFDAGNYQSLLSRAAIQFNAGSATRSVDALFGSLWKLPTAALSGLIGQPVYAQAEYDYGFPEFGFTAGERDKHPDPYAIEAEVEQPGRLEELNEKYGKCFSTTIEPGTKRVISGETVNYYAETNENTPVGFEDCRIKPGDPNYDEFTLYRFYLMAKVSERAVECYGGIEDSCDQVGYGSGAAATPNGSGNGSQPPTDDVKTLAERILAEPKITYPLQADDGSGTSRLVLEALVRGEPAPVTCRNGTAGSTTSTTMSPNVLQFVLDYGLANPLGVNALSDKCHGANSNHYRGTAVDFQCRNVPFNLSLADSIAAKYGGKRNSETCAADRHWHYDF